MDKVNEASNGIVVTGLNQTARKIFAGNTAKGFYDEINQMRDVINTHAPALKKDFESLVVAQRCALITTETSETVEADRKGITFVGKLIDVFPLTPEEFKRKLMELPDEAFKAAFEQHVKDTKEDEVADQFIRAFDFAGANDVDIEFHIQAKLRYNSLRPHKHGKAY